MGSFIANPFEKRWLSLELRSGGGEWFWDFVFSPSMQDLGNWFTLAVRNETGPWRERALYLGKQKASVLPISFVSGVSFDFPSPRNWTGWSQFCVADPVVFALNCAEKASSSPTLPAPSLQGKSVQHERGFKLQDLSWRWESRSWGNVVRFSEGN